VFSPWIIVIWYANNCIQTTWRHADGSCIEDGITKIIIAWRGIYLLHTAAFEAWSYLVYPTECGTVLIVVKMVKTWNQKVFYCPLAKCNFDFRCLVGSYVETVSTFWLSLHLSSSGWNGKGITGWWCLIIPSHTRYIHSAVALFVSINANLVWYCPHTFNLLLLCLVSTVHVVVVDEYWYKLTAMLFGSFVESYGSTLTL